MLVTGEAVNRDLCPGATVIKKGFQTFTWKDYLRIQYRTQQNPTGANEQDYKSSIGVRNVVAITVSRFQVC